MNKLIFFVLIYSQSPLAHEIFLGGISKHFGNENVTNENHELVALEFNHIIGGTFINSYGNRSYLLGYSAEWNKDHWLSFHLAAGVVKGYSDEQYKYLPCFQSEVCPTAIVGLSVNTPYTKPHLFLMGNALVFTLGFEF